MAPEKGGKAAVAVKKRPNRAQLEVIAHDVDPITLVAWLPALYRKMEVPYVTVKGKPRLRAIVHEKTASASCLPSVKNGDKLEFEHDGHDKKGETASWD